MVHARPESVYHIQHQRVHARTQVLKSPLCTMIHYMWNLLLVPTPHLHTPLASFAQLGNVTGLRTHTGWYHGRLRARAWVGTL